MKIAFGFYQIPSSRYDPSPPNCQIIKWHKKVGDKVKKGDLLFMYEADKVGEIDLESPFNGTITVIKERYREEADQEGRLWVWNKKNMEFQKAGVILHLPELGYIEIEDAVPNDASKEQGEKEKEEGETSQARSAPVARSLAREKGIDINTIQGTGPFGRVMREDVEKTIAEHTKNSESSPSLDDRESLHATQIRKTIAYFMQKSHAEIPKAGDSITVDITHFWKFYRERRNVWLQDTGTDFSFTGIWMFLATRLLHERRKDFGIINAYWDKDKDDAYLFKHVNIGIAVQTAEGLMIPVIHSAETLSFREFMTTVHDKIHRAMNKKITLPELRDLTFTVNNVGAMGGENPDSIVPYIRESSGKERPTGMIMVLTQKWQNPAMRQFIKFAFSFDHRLFDGVPALLFVRAIRDYIESKKNPEEFCELFNEDFTINK